MTKTCSLTQAAATLGIHRNTLSDWLAKGCPAVTRADKAQGIDWELSIPAVFEWRNHYLVREAVAGYQSAGGQVTKEEADRRRAVAMAVTAEVEADTILGTVVLRADVETTLADFCQALRSGLDNAGTRIAGRSTMMTNPNEIRELCATEHNRAFRAAEEELREQWKEISSRAPGAPDPSDDDD